MNNLDNIYGAGSDGYLKPKHIQDGDRPFLWIKSAVVETKTFNEKDGPKSMIVLSFFKQPGAELTEKKWSLNKTQALALQQLYGSFENDGWAFKGIRIYKAKTTFQGESKDTIAIYPDPFDMTPEQRAQAEQIRNQEMQQAAQTAAMPTHSGPPQAQGGFAPPVAPQVPSTAGFAPASGPSSDDPTKNW